MGQVRDHLMDRQYFEEYMEEESRLLAQVQSSLRQGKVAPQQIPLVESRAIAHQLCILTARYNLGEDIGEIRREYCPLLAKAASYDHPGVSQVTVIDTVALAVLFEPDEEEWATISKMAQECGRKDWLVGFLLSYHDHNEEYKDRKIFMKRPYELLRNIIEESPQKTEDLRGYMKKWYRAMGFAPWHDIHKRQVGRKDKFYNGYWCNEAAAVVKLLELDDSGLKDEPYYPYDLAHFRKEED